MEVSQITAHLWVLNRVISGWLGCTYPGCWKVRRFTSSTPMALTMGRSENSIEPCHRHHAAAVILSGVPWVKWFTSRPKDGDLNRSNTPWPHSTTRFDKLIEDPDTYHQLEIQVLIKLPGNGRQLVSALFPRGAFQLDICVMATSGNNHDA